MRQGRRIPQFVMIMTLGAAGLGGQTPPPTPAPATAVAGTPAPEMSTRDTPATFSTRVNLVMVPVVVRDGKGHAIGTLRQEDFQLLDKGKPQVITKFSVEKPGMPAIAAEVATDEKALPSVPPEKPAPAIPQRFVAYLVDDMHLAVGDLLQVRAAAKKHLGELEETTRAALFTTSGRGNLEFTDDRDKLLRAVDALQPWTSAASTVDDCPDVSYYQVDLIRNQNDTSALSVATSEAMVCLNLDPTQPASQQIAQAAANAAAGRAQSVGDQETHVSLTVLKDIVRRLAAAPGSRSLVLLSPGFYLTIDHRFDETELMDRAIRANVTISSVGARGVYNPDPIVDASQRVSTINGGLAKRQFAIQSAQANEDILAELADATGGTFFHNNNDLAAGLKQVAAQPEFVYVLGFSPQNLKYDGGFHSLKVVVKIPRGLELQARRGYYAPKHVIDPEQQAKEEVREALFSRDEMNDIPVNLNMQFFKSSAANARLTVIARVDLKQLRFRKAEDRNLNTLTIVAAVFDRNGNFMTGLQKVVDMKLKDQTLANLPTTGISIRNIFDLTPGTYAVRLVVRDAEGQAMAARNGTVQIP